MKAGGVKAASLRCSIREAYKVFDSPGVEGDAGHPGVVARAPGHAAARLQAVQRHQVVLPPRGDEPPVGAPRAAQQPAVVALQQAMRKHQKQVLSTMVSLLPGAASVLA